MCIISAASSSSTAPNHADMLKSQWLKDGFVLFHLTTFDKAFLQPVIDTFLRSAEIWLPPHPLIINVLLHRIIE